ncbi:hypothetical protein RHS01_07336 [Rhizoctonia solani]|uniref:RNA-directed DNA polymerase n=1 Tax=Rhizoctonia solani TaxID=456999 RepID=A0A8H7I7U5_9AGAM|nr:hypothetical protein RHS01_07336 [Rhizoctonia solani]
MPSHGLYGDIHFEQLALGVVSMSYPVILGFDWLRSHNPTIDWESGTLTLSCCRVDAPGPLVILSVDPLGPSPISSTHIVSAETPTIEPSPVASPPSPSVAPSGPSPSHSDSATPPRSPDIRLVGAARFSKCEREIRSSLPEPYWDFASVFDPVEVDTLPPRRPYDIKIDLEDGKTPPFGPIYSLTRDERAALADYIDKNLAKGFIRRSTSSAASPILFVKRKSGELASVSTTEVLMRSLSVTVFSKIDLKNAFNLIRIAAGDEWKTAFRTNLGLFEYLVMPFGLTNAPATFQALIQDVLRDLLDITCVVYLDDILIFSRSESEHVDHVRAVLERLRAHGLFANAKKCEFHRTEVEYLGYLITVDGISMHPSKLESISSWPVPRSVKDIQSFLGFTNFYRRFIAHYASICKPLNDLTHKDVPLGPRRSLTLTDDALRSFNDLKEAFQSRPVLRHFNPALPSTLLTDASDFAISGIHCQPGESGALHPVAFFSRKLTPAEINYEIYDKEMLAIVDSLRHMRPWLLGTTTPVSIVTDHRNLEYFMSTRVLNRRQARWSLFLADFNFVLSYAPGSRNPADAPSRRPDYVPKEGDATLTGQQQVLLGPHRLSSLSNASALHVCALSSIITPLVRSCIAATFSIGDPDFLSRLKQAVASDSQWLEALESNDPDFRSANDTALHRDKLYVPAPLRVEVLRSRHDAILAGHPGRAGTFELVSRDFSWPGLRRFVRAYVTGCDLCARTKAERHCPYGLLQPLEVPSRPWKSISMDFIVKLPTSHGCDTVWVVVDRFSKMAHFIPTVETIKAPDLARLFLQHIFRAHGLPDTIISDRGSIFVSHFWTRLHELIGVRLKHSTAYHPRTDGQTERINQILEAYLRCYTSYQQDDWVDYLPLAEFAYNNRTSSSSQQSPFYANYGFHPTFEPRINSDTTVPAAEDLSARLSLIHDELRAELTHSQADAAQQFNRSVKPAPNFTIGDRVWLLRRNIKTTRPSDKLDYRKLGPFKIVAARGPVSFQLELPPSLSRLHPVFHVSLLEPHHSPSDIPGRVEPAPPPVFLDGDSTPWREVDKILDCRKIGRRYDYFVSWKGLTPDENSWVPLSDMSTGLNELIERFHRRTTNRRLPRPPPLLLYPTKPRGSPSVNSPPDPSTPDDNAPAPFEPVRLPTPPPERHVSYTPPPRRHSAPVASLTLVLDLTPLLRLRNNLPSVSQVLDHRRGVLLRTQVRNTVTPARDRHLVATPSPRSPCSPRPPAPSLRPVVFMRFFRASTSSLRYPRIPRGRCAHSHDIGPDSAKLRLGPSVLTIGRAEPLGSHSLSSRTSFISSCIHFSLSLLFRLRAHGHFLTGARGLLAFLTRRIHFAYFTRSLRSLSSRHSSARPLSFGAYSLSHPFRLCESNRDDPAIMAARYDVRSKLLPTPPIGTCRHYLSTPAGHLEILYALPGHATIDSSVEESWKAPVLFLHGGFGSANCYSNFLPLFTVSSWPRKVLETILLDFVLCPKDVFAEDVIAALKFIRKRHANVGPITLVGHSAGGGLAQYIVGNGRAEGVGKLVVLAGIPSFGMENIPKLAYTDPWFLVRALWDLYHPRTALSSTKLVHRAFFSPNYPIEKVQAFEAEMAPFESMSWPMGMMFPFVSPMRVLNNLGIHGSKAPLLTIAGAQDTLVSVPIMRV